MKKTNHELGAPPTAARVVEICCRNRSTEWLPPPQLPLKGGANDFHHPERLLGGD